MTFQRTIIFVTLLCTLLCPLFVYGQEAQRERRVRVIGENKPVARLITSKPRTITTKRKTKRTILLRKSVVLKESFVADELARASFRLVNKKRVEKGLRTLNWNPGLASVARAHSEEMATQGYFSHFGAGGKTVDERAVSFGIDNWKAIGENIAYSQGITNPAEFCVSRWLMSRSHRTNMLNSSWTSSGMGVAVTEDGKHFFTQVFSR